MLDRHTGVHVIYLDPPYKLNEADYMVTKAHARGLSMKTCGTLPVTI